MFYRLVVVLTFLLLPLVARAQESLLIATNIYPPYVNDDVENSFLPNLFTEIGARMGVRFRFEIMPWRRCQQEVENHNAWGTIPYRKTELREQTFAFSDPLYLQDSHFFAYDKHGNEPRYNYTELADLRGYRIGGVYGYYYESWFEEAGLNVDYAHSEEQNLRRLQLGRIDLFPTATTIAWYQIRQLFPPEEVANFYTLETPLIDGAGLHLMTSKTFPNNDVLLKRFNEAMAEIKSSGTYTQLVEKHGLTLRY
ncbi:ABC transporter substrate-binding protein [Thalassospira tepidiphila]|uniref:substrate-binding periplasmic protein n=1 Tax=Thalassospira tepidiphila TaxID=393657 RepID=UPI001BCB0E2F|nr:transporter substrate-binding domain-containing protein [Thalassospira tepidiphila]MBR9901928.1 amino acid ABC transporter substrate-binding protein [Rhodospirillales bacterium]MBS8274866.1 ABC transporter substrate-binding protein [Thalassospira tepidiphila]